MEYIVNIVAVVNTDSEEEARRYIDRKMRGPYTKDYSIVSVEYKNGKP